MRPLPGLQGSQAISTITGVPVPSGDDVMKKYNTLWGKQLPGLMHKVGMEAAEFIPGAGEKLSFDRAREMGKEAEKDIAQGNFNKGFLKYLEAQGDVIGTLPFIHGATIAGRKAFGASKSLLKKAMSMGGNRKEIVKATGWFKGMDGHWKFEINDRDMTLKNLAHHPGAEVPMDTIVSHDKLFTNYPELKDTTVSIKLVSGMGPGMSEGSFQIPSKLGLERGRSPRIEVRAPNLHEAKNTLLHEIQHNVQFVEGFARGGDWTEFPAGKVPKPVAKALDSARKELADKTYLRFKDLRRSGLDKNKALATAESEVWDGHSGLLKRIAELETKAERARQKEPYEKYRRLAGEIEANDVSFRQNMTDDMRRRFPPEMHSDPIVKFRAGQGPPQKSAGYKKALDDMIKGTRDKQIKTDLKSVRDFVHDDSIEQVKAAAVKHSGGKIATGRDHASIYETLEKEGVPWKNTEGVGFVTDTGKYMDREQAHTLYRSYTADEFFDPNIKDIIDKNAVDTILRDTVTKVAGKPKP